MPRDEEAARQVTKRSRGREKRICEAMDEEAAGSVARDEEDGRLRDKEAVRQGIKRILG